MKSLTAKLLILAFVLSAGLALPACKTRTPEEKRMRADRKDAAFYDKIDRRRKKKLMRETRREARWKWLMQ